MWLLSIHGNPAHLLGKGDLQEGAAGEIRSIGKQKTLPMEGEPPERSS